MSEREPQAPEPSNFDQWERAGNQELKLMTTLADVERKHAETLHQYAQTANLEEATKAAQFANEKAIYIEHRVRVRDYEVRQKLKKMEDMRPALQILKEGRKVSSSTVASVWQAFSWFLGNTPSGKWSALLAARLPDEAMGFHNYIQVLSRSPKVGISQVQPNLGAVTRWLAEEFLLPAAGSTLHQKIIELIGSLETTEGERAAALEAWQDKLHTASQEELKAVRELLQVSLKSS